MVSAAADGTSGPRIHDVEDQGRVHRDGRVQTTRRLPGAIADSSHPLALRPREVQRQAAAIAGDYVTVIGQSDNFHLHALDRRVHEAGGASSGRLFSQHVPRLGRLAQFERQAGVGHASENGIAEFENAPRTIRPRRHNRRY